MKYRGGIFETKEVCAAHFSPVISAQKKRSEHVCYFFFYLLPFSLYPVKQSKMQHPVQRTSKVCSTREGGLGILSKLYPSITWRRMVYKWIQNCDGGQGQVCM